MSDTTESSGRKSDFDNLVKNGLDFLEKAIAQLDSEPKYSVINFFTAVEIFLKAPLVHEHWSLVVADRDPNRQNYEAGDFVSVSFDDACTRLALSLKKQLRKSAKDAFDKVRKHRNRMVHFYHSGTSDKQRDAIKLEQAQAWFELNRFVTDDWRKEFDLYLREFKRMENILINNNHYAQAKFLHIKPQIEGAKTAGSVFRTCPKCGTDACEVKKPAPTVQELTDHSCRVCFFRDTRLQVTCPSCHNKNQHLSPSDPFVCNECDHTITSPHNIFKFLDQSKPSYNDIDESQTPANCDECQGYETVCEYGDGYLCANCLSFFDSLSNCQWCNASMTGSSEDTYVTGCEHCEGLSGHRRDD